MASKRALRSDDVSGFVRAFNDETMDLCEMFGVRVEWGLCKGKFASELYFRGVAYRRDMDGSEQVYATVERVWPSHRYLSLHACLYAAAIGLSVAVARKFREETGKTYPGQLD